MMGTEKVAIFENEPVIERLVQHCAKSNDRIQQVRLLQEMI